MYIQVILMKISENLLKYIFFAIQKEILSAQDLPKMFSENLFGFKMNEIGLTCLF